MADRPFVGRIHTEPEDGRRDMSDPRWEVVAPLLETLGIGDVRRMELWSRDGLTVMTVEAEGDVFHISIQVGETHYHCFAERRFRAGRPWTSGHSPTIPASCVTIGRR